MNFGSDYPTGPTKFRGRVASYPAICSLGLSLSLFCRRLLPIVLPWQFVVALCGAPIFAIIVVAEPNSRFWVLSDCTDVVAGFQTVRPDDRVGNGHTCNTAFRRSPLLPPSCLPFSLGRSGS